MTDSNALNDDYYPLHLSIVDDLFVRAEIDAVLDQPQWAAKYPDVINVWKSPDKFVSCHVRLPEEIVLAIARECTCQADFFADPDGQTLHLAGHGRKPYRTHTDANNLLVDEEIIGATKLSVEQAFIEYGPDAVWLAQENGKSRKGERNSRGRLAALNSKCGVAFDIPSS